MLLPGVLLSAGWPESVPAVTLDRQCGSSQQAVHFAAAGLMSGQSDIVVAGGVENMSMVPIGITARVPDIGSPSPQELLDRYGIKGFNQGLGAEMIAEKWGFSRTDCDEFAARSHRLLGEAIEAGRLAGQIAPVDLPDGGRLEVDEGLRAGTSVESLSGLKPVYKEDGVVHAGNASQISDGAAALVICSAEYAEANGLEVWAEVGAPGQVAGPDTQLHEQPARAIEDALRRAGWSLEELDFVEVNEAFGAVVAASSTALGYPLEKTNIHGGAIALGHPIGASGARVALHAALELRRRGSGRAAVSLCGGGGQGEALLLYRD